MFLRRAVAAASVAVLATGCRSVLPGVGIADPRTDRGVIPALLDTGLYPTTPRPALGAAGNEEVGKLIEARRMAEAVLLPAQINPGLTNRNAGQCNPGTLTAAGAGRNWAWDLDQDFGHQLSTAITTDDFVAGFLNCAAGNHPVSLTNVVLRYATARAALSAAAAMARADINPDSKFRWSAVPESDRPDTVVLLGSEVASEGRPEYGTAPVRAIAYTSYGPYVLARAAVAEDAPEAQQLALSGLDQQRSALDTFTATPVGELAELPTDPTGLAAKTLPDRYSPLTAVYGPHGILSFPTNTAKAQDLFTATGVTAAAFSTANVYQARDPVAAAELAAGLSDEKVSGEYPLAPAGPVPGMPDARCLLPHVQSGVIGEVHCVIPAGRYVVEVRGSGVSFSKDPVGAERDAHRRLAAQYLMVTAS
ncbi:hypothetical protein MCEMAEM6B_02456 [Mycobacteriaceae bacterium]